MNASRQKARLAWPILLMIAALAMSLWAGSARAADAIVTKAAAPARSRITVALDVLTFWRPSGQRLFHNGAKDAGVGLSASFDTISLGRRGMLALGGGWYRESSSSTWAGGNRSDFSANSLYASAALRFAVWSWLQPYARVCGGAAFGKAQLGLGGDVQGGRSSAWSLEGSARSAMGSVGAGLHLRTHTLNSEGSHMPPLALSAALEGGYELATRMPLVVAPPAPANDKIAQDQIATEGIALGDLARSRPYFRLALAIHF